MLWLISHPESVDTRECDEADLVLVASQRLATELRARTKTPVEVMLQATDPRRFGPRAPDPQHAHAVAVVAMTRRVFRPAVAYALATGLRPAIYGTGWRDFVDPALIMAEFVPNDELATVYSSVGVLLNDHWDTMRNSGIVSNRLFDALACGTPIVSDHLPELGELFGDAVSTYGGCRAAAPGGRSGAGGSDRGTPTRRGRSGDRAGPPHLRSSGPPAAGHPGPLRSGPTPKMT